MRKNVLVFGLLVFVGIVTFVVGCSQVVSTSSGSYFPHENGYSWEYAITSSSSTLESYVTFKFNGTTTIAGTIEVQNWEAKQSGSTSISYIKVESNGVYSYGGTYATAETGTLMLPLPPSVGQAGIISGGTTYEVLARENVTVPAGTFDCYKVRAYYSSGYNDFWWGAGAGLVKSYSYYVYSSIVYTGTIELKSKNF